jgi:transcriptional regulator with XRE-family HTH domain
VVEFWDSPGLPGGPLPAEGELGIALRRARDAAGLSQRDLAQRCGVTQGVVSRLERGHRTNWTQFCRLVAATGREPVLTTRRSASDLLAEADELATIPPAERVARHNLLIAWLIGMMPASGWALDGDCALLTHGIPVTPGRRFEVAVVDDPSIHRELNDRQREWVVGVTVRSLPALPPLTHVDVGIGHVPLLPIDHILLGAVGTPERNEREWAVSVYLSRLSRTS